MTGPRWARDPELLWRATPFAVVVRSRHAGEATVLGGTGAALWDLLDAPRSVADLADVLARRFVSDTDTVVADLNEILPELERRGIVRAVP